MLVFGIENQVLVRTSVEASVTDMMIIDYLLGNDLKFEYKFQTAPGEMD